MTPSHKKYNKFLVLLTVLACSITGQLFAQVGFNVEIPDSSSVMEIQSTDKGILIPRMTTADRNAMANGTVVLAEGLMVFDTDEHRFYFWNATALKWFAINPFKYSNNGIEDDLTINESTNVGLSTTTPQSKLSVAGNASIGSGYVGVSAPDDGLIVEGNVGVGQSTADEALEVTGDASISDTLTAHVFEGYGIIPLGGIISWAGFESDIPDNWEVCDGNGGVPVNGVTIPDLRGRFIVGTGQVNGSSGTNYTMNATGGEQEHELSLAEMPAHNHGGFTGYDGTHSHTYNGSQTVSTYTCSICDSGNDHIKSKNKISSDPADYGGDTEPNHTHAFNTAGGNDAHENRPPFYSLSFIVRVK